MYLCKALLNVCIYDKGAIKIRYNNNNNNRNTTLSTFVCALTFSDNCALTFSDNVTMML